MGIFGFRKTEIKPDLAPSGVGGSLSEQKPLVDREVHRLAELARKIELARTEKPEIQADVLRKISALEQVGISIPEGVRVISDFAFQPIPDELHPKSGVAGLQEKEINWNMPQPNAAQLGEEEYLAQLGTDQIVRGPAERLKADSVTIRVITLNENLEAIEGIENIFGVSEAVDQVTRADQLVYIGSVFRSLANSRDVSVPRAGSHRDDDNYRKTKPA